MTKKVTKKRTPEKRPIPEALFTRIEATEDIDTDASIRAAFDVAAGRHVTAVRDVQADRQVRAAVDVVAGRNVRAEGDLVAEDCLHVYRDAFVYGQLFSDNLKGQMTYITPPSVLLRWQEVPPEDAMTLLLDYIDALNAQLLAVGVMAKPRGGRRDLLESQTTQENENDN